MPVLDGIFVGCLFAGASIIALVVLVIVLMSQKTGKGDIEKGEASPPVAEVSDHAASKSPDAARPNSTGPT